MYRQVAVLLEKDPSLATILEKSDLQAVLTLLHADEGAWTTLTPVLVSLLEVKESRITWVSQEDNKFLVDKATLSLLQHQPFSPILANLTILQLFVPNPSYETVVAVINEARQIIKDINFGKRDNAVNKECLMALEMLHVWHRHLPLSDLPSWHCTL